MFMAPPCRDACSNEGAPTRTTILAAALIGVPATAACGSDDSPAAAAPNPAATPKNIIFFRGDGYGMVPMTAARIYAGGEDGELIIDTFPETALVKTYSNDAQVTGSAPSMSAYLTGVKMNNEVVITHATPAAPYAHICHRDGENTIAAQLVPGGAGFNDKLADGVDVILGGGWQHFLPKGAAAGSSRTDTRARSACSPRAP